MAMNRYTPWDGILQGGLKPATFLDMLRSYDVLRVPDYQRPYSWRRPEARFLFNDVKTSGDAKSPWFMGMVYLQRMDTSKSVAELLDGQQRVTTWFLLLVALREALSDSEVRKQSMAKHYCQMVYEAYGSGSGGYSCRFQASEGWNSFFNHKDLIAVMGVNVPQENEPWAKIDASLRSVKENIDEGSEALSVKRAIDNWDMFRGFFNSLQAKEVMSFCKGMERQVWVIDVELTGSRKSKLLFEGINSRGRSLDLLDKIRFRMLSSDCWSQSTLNLSDTEKLWSTIFAELNVLQNAFGDDSSIGLEGFLRGMYEEKKARWPDEWGQDKLPTSMESHEDWWVFIGAEWREDGVEDARLMIEWLEKYCKWLGVFRFLVCGEGVNNSVLKLNEVKARGGIDAVVFKDLLGLVREACTVSGNWVWFLSALIDTHWGKTREKFTNHLWGGIKYLYSEELLLGRQSNVVRVNMFKAGSASSPPKIDLTKPAVVAWRGVARHSDARFILLLASFLSKDDWVVIRGELAYPKKGLDEARHVPEVDHFAPMKDNVSTPRWAGLTVGSSRKDIMRWLKANGKGFKHLDLSGLNDELKEKSDALFVLQSGKKARSGSLIDWVGNKWLLDYSKNRQKSNKDFVVSKKYYAGRIGNQGFALPKRDDIGWEEQLKGGKWGPKNILSRSFRIHEFILQRSTWVINNGGVGPKANLKG